MKHLSTILFFLFALIEITYAQESELVGNWQLLKVEVDGETYENLKALYIFEEGGILKAARSAHSEIIEVGKWRYNRKQKMLTMTSSFDKDFNGKATLIDISSKELVYEKDKALLHFIKVVAPITNLATESTSNANIPARLDFSEADFFNENGEYLYYEDEEKLPWQDIDYMLLSLANVKQLEYKVSKLDEASNTFKEQILRADVNSNPGELTLSIDYIFNGYDRYTLPDDTELMPNNEYSNLLYPEEDNSFRVAGTEQISTEAGSFDCTVVELIGSFDTLRKLWMINNKPGIFAKIIIDRPGDFGQFWVYELQGIKMIE